jgi:thiamine biosynthesis lipoprotein
MTVTTSPEALSPPDAGERTYSRAELLLGTLVRVSVRAAGRPPAQAALDAAFAELRLIHRLMSFHRPDSDVSRVNRTPVGGAVDVDWRTAEVIRTAARLSERSGGHFDITVAPELVAAGYLPAPITDREPDTGASWRDLVWVADNTLQLSKKAWIDLGGIAKGYAVDRAVAACLGNGAASCLVEAGGDLRVSGAMTAAVRLAAPRGDNGHVPLVELSDGSLASSHGATDAAVTGNRESAPHINGLTRAALDPRCFVSVLCEECVLADALTKVVLSQGADAGALLAACGATALLHEPEAGWLELP